MSNESQPLAGFFRVLYFLAATTVTVAVVATGVATFADSPERRDPYATPYQDDQVEQFQDEQAAYEKEQADYERDTGLVLSLVGTAVMAAAVLGLGSRFNALRGGLLLGGLLLFLTGVGGQDAISFSSGGPERSDVWISFFVSCIAFVTVIGSCRWLDEGMPVGGRFQSGAARPPDVPPPPPPPELVN
jgi:hypothetical protein